LEIITLIKNKDTILVSSWDPELEAARKRLLEGAGYEVLLARGSNGIRKLCEKKRVSLVVIGYSMPPSEKRRVWVEARAACKTPILQLYRGSKPELMESTALFAYQTNGSDDFVRAVQDILERKNQN
jgi:DNA-binding response OmpR family regulator